MTAKQIVEQHGEMKVIQFLIGLYLDHKTPECKPDLNILYTKLHLEGDNIAAELEMEAECAGTDMGGINRMVNEWLAAHPY